MSPRTLFRQLVQYLPEGVKRRGLLNESEPRVHDIQIGSTLPLGTSIQWIVTKVRPDTGDGNLFTLELRFEKVSCVKWKVGFCYLQKVNL